MTATLTLRDETLDGRTLAEWSLDVLSETLSVRELIRERVYQEVQDHNARGAGPFRGLVAPSPPDETTPEERALNGVRVPKPIDWKRQFEAACEAFETGRILIVVDEKQAESLDEQFTVRPGSAVTFLRLTLLVGG